MHWRAARGEPVNSASVPVMAGVSSQNTRHGLDAGAGASEEKRSMDSILPTHLTHRHPGRTIRQLGWRIVNWNSCGESVGQFFCGQ